MKRIHFDEIDQLEAFLMEQPCSISIRLEDDSVIMTDYNFEEFKDLLTGYSYHTTQVKLFDMNQDLIKE